jgi:hypothetical protein
MSCSNSSEFFAITMEYPSENGWKSRLLCLKDFLKKCLAFPFILIAKACKTFFRLIGMCLSAGLLILTLGSSTTIKELFIRRVTCFAADAADWILLPLAFILCFFRLILALCVRPNFYFKDC